MCCSLTQRKNLFRNMFSVWHFEFLRYSGSPHPRLFGFTLAKHCNLLLISGMPWTKVFLVVIGRRLVLDDGMFFQLNIGSYFWLLLSVFPSEKKAVNVWNIIRLSKLAVLLFLKTTGATKNLATTSKEKENYRLAVQSRGDSCSLLNL